MATSIFDKKEYQPEYNDLQNALKSSGCAWEGFIEYLQERYGVIETEWKFYSKSAGWCLRVFGEKRNIVFLSPNDNFFVTTVNMGVKVKEQILRSNISECNKKLIDDAAIYAEGISVLFTIKNEDDLNDIKTILNIRDNI